MMAAEHQSRQDELLSLFEETQSIIEEFVTTRQAAEQAQRGTQEQWAAKDLLAAVGFWMDYMVERMGYFVRSETAPKFVDFAALNVEAIAAHEDQSWPLVVAYARRSLAALVAATRQFPDRDFAMLNSYDDGPGDPLWGEVQANGFIWPLQECEKYYQHTGETERAEGIRVRLEAVIGKPVTIVADLIAPPELQQQQLRAATTAMVAVPLVIDVRGPREYTLGHVAGAVNIPLDELESRYRQLAEGRPVVTYCNMHQPGQSRGEQAAAWLKERGFQAMALRGGFPAWREAGLPVDSGQSSSE